MLLITKLRYIQAYDAFSIAVCCVALLRILCRETADALSLGGRERIDKPLSDHFILFPLTAVGLVYISHQFITQPLDSTRLNSKLQMSSLNRLLDAQLDANLVFNSPDKKNEF